MTLKEFFKQLYEQAVVHDFVNNVQANFQIRNRVYLGAQYLPLVSTGERGNMFREDGFEMISSIAYDGTRYSDIPVRKAGRGKGMIIELGANDKGTYIEGPDFDALVKRLNQNLTPEALAQLLDLVGTHVVQPLTEIIEKQRWQALADARIIRIGDNDYGEEILFENPVGHRVTVASGTDAAPAGWYDPTHDPMADIYALAQTLQDAGYEPTAIITSSRMVNLLSNHPKVKASLGRVVQDPTTSNLVTTGGRARLAEINGLLSEDSLPPLQTYNLRYVDHDGSQKRFLRDDALVMLSTDPVDPTYVEPDTLLEPTALGYVGNGITAGRTENGRTVALKVNSVEQQEIKNPNVHAVGTQMTLPILLRSKAVGCLNIPAKAAA
jgi:hypothetical protein